MRTWLATWTMAFFALLCGGCGGEPTPAQSADEAACPYVEARPSYLPWLEEGEEVPEPQRSVENGTSYVSWSSGGDDPSRQSSVVFRRNSEPMGGKGEPVAASLEGAAGYYYDGPGPQAAVLWKTDAHPCGLVTLTLSLPGADQAELRHEILRVADSLET